MKRTSPRYDPARQASLSNMLLCLLLPASRAGTASGNPAQTVSMIRTYNGSVCVFPFTFQGETYSACTTEGNRLPWCATKVDEDANYIEDQWDFCDYDEYVDNDDNEDDLSSSIVSTWSGGEECENPCSGQKCNEVAEMMKHLVDFTVDPCQDFFAFSCSTKTRGQKPPIARARIDDFKSLIRDPPEGFEYISKFFTSCIQINQTERTTQEVFFNCFEGDGKCTEEKAAEYGSIYAQFFKHTKRFVNNTAFPAAVPEAWWDKRTRAWFGEEGWTWWDFSATILKNFYFLAAFDLEQVEGKRPNERSWEKKPNERSWDKFRTNLFFAPLIDSVAEKENEFTSRHSIYLVPITIPHAIKTGDEEYFVQYRQLLTGFITSFRDDTTQIEEDVERIIAMEKELGQITQGYESKSVWWTHAEFTEAITIRELSEEIPAVPWKDYIEKTFSENPDFKLQGSTRIWIPPRPILRDIAGYVDNLSARDQANLLTWRMFSRFANDFMATGAGKHDIQDDIFSGIAGSEDRGDNCMAQIRTFFPEAENDMIIGKYIDHSTKNDIKDMFNRTAEEFISIVNDQDWMSQRTKFRARQKVEAMGLNVGELSPRTEEFKVLKERMTKDDYIENILAIGNYRFDSLVKKIDTDIKKRTGSETERNAYYHRNYNEMTILTGLLHGFLGIGLDFEIPPALLYGGFRTLGHEMIHGFDELGSKYDKDGFRVNWWRKNETAEFTKKTNCLVKQYQDFGIKFEGTDYHAVRPECRVWGPGCKIPSLENVADNGAIQPVFHAYQNLPQERKQCVPGFNFTSDQLFWLGYSFYWCTTRESHEKINFYQDLLRKEPSVYGHYPAPWRVNTVFSNSPEFAEAFNCPLNSPLNPPREEQCSVWRV